MTHDPTNGEPQLREELVAYLDGELDSEQSRRIEQRAAVEPDSRRMLEELDRTWHMLDELDAPPTSEDFTRTTMEMVALAAVGDAQKVKAAGPRRRLRIAIFSAAVLAASAAAGFLLVTGLIRDPNQELLDDLPILESLDQYQKVESLDFLQALRKEKLFPEDGNEGSSVTVVSADLLTQPRQRIGQMSDDQREDLFRSEQQFRALKPEQQQPIRDLNRQLESSPDRDKLRATMNRYCKWYESQSPYNRGMLMNAKTVSERVDAIKRLLKTKNPGHEIRLDDVSRRQLAAWLERYLKEHEARFLETVKQGPLGGIGTDFAKLPPDRQQLAVREMLLKRWQVPGPAGRFPLTEPESTQIRAALSPELRAKLEARQPAEQGRLLVEWVRDVASYEPDEQLVVFFESTALSDEERDHLMSLSGDEMYKRLGDKYRDYMTKHAKAAEPRRNDPAHRADRWPGQRGHRQTYPWGSGGRRPGENRDDKLAPPAKATPSGNSTAPSPPADEKPSAEQPANK